METAKTMTLEAQIASLQAQIDFMRNNQTRSVSPARRLQEVRKVCREKYFGTWAQMFEGEADYGPDGKGRSDYRTIMEILTKESAMLYKYSRGKACVGETITSLIQGEEDLKEYENICDRICRNLKDEILSITKV